MTSRKDFYTSLTSPQPDPTLNTAQQALWWIGRDNWSKAHDLVQSEEGNPACDRIHALLHRQEKDIPNARYWYARARAKMPDTSLRTEWETLVSLFIP